MSSKRKFQLSPIFLMLSWLTLALVSWYYLAEGSVGSVVEQITIWGKSAIWDIYIPGDWINFDFGFGPGYFVAIKPLFKICMIFLFGAGFFLFPPMINRPFFTGGNFLFHRIGRFLYMMGGVCGVSAYLKFSQFVSELNEIVDIYHLAWSYYLGIVVYILVILIGFISMVSKIVYVPPKLVQRTRREEAIVTEEQEEIKKDDYPEIGSTELTRVEKIELVKSIIANKKETKISWLETATLISEDEIIEIATKELGMIVDNGLIFTQEEAKKRIAKK